MIEALRAMPFDADVRLCICVGDDDNPAALAEVAFCESLAAFAADADREGLELEEDGTVTLRGWYDERSVAEQHIGSVEVKA